MPRPSAEVLTKTSGFLLFSRLKIGKKSFAFPYQCININSMEDHEPYDPEVYKRLELVRKQFKCNTADLKTQQTVEKRQEMTAWLAQHKQGIVRWAVYVFLVMLVLAVIGVTIAEALRR